MSDKPGAGKTFVILALIYFTKLFGSLGINIIVVPHSLYSQWLDSINQFIGDLLTYKCLIEYNDIVKLFVDKSLLYQFDILITTPLYYDVLATTINSSNISVRRLFFDEADSMKNLLINALKADMTWFISASIHSIFNNGINAKIGVYEISLEQLIQNECYCEPDFIDSNIKLLKPNLEEFICYDFYIDTILSKILDEESILYINSHNYLYIKKECGNNNINNTNEIVKSMYKNARVMIDESEIILKELQKDKSSSKTKVDNQIKKEENTDKLNKIRRLININGLCIECLENIENKCFLSECEDYLCEKCYINEKNLIKCNICNKNHKKDSYIEKNIIINSKKRDYLKKCENNKFIILEKIFDVCEEKIILFSNNKNLNSYLQKYCSDKDFKFEELNGGNIKEIDKILNNFKNNNFVKILLIDNVYFGVGLNLEYTTDIIFFQNCDNKIKNQLIGRAQRYGRKSRLNVWLLKYSNEK